MTRKQRAQVVELLRCAADCCALERGRVWFDTVAFLLGADSNVVELARKAAVCVQEEPHFDAERIEAARRGLDVMPNEWGLRVSLEAAQRIEEGWTPCFSSSRNTRRLSCGATNAPAAASKARGCRRSVMPSVQRRGIGGRTMNRRCERDVHPLPHHDRDHLPHAAAPADEGEERVRAVSSLRPHRPY